MAPKFGTSGLRGLVTELTPALIADHLRAFLSACDAGQALFVGRDLRPSSPDIAGDVISAALAEGFDVVDCGAVPTPALAFAARKAGASAVMVTGSHIPADRNGLKFYTPAGEITKADEAAILAALARPAGAKTGSLRADDNVGATYNARYLSAFGAGALSGLRIGLYSHSAVGRDLLLTLLRDLGAEVREYGRAEGFIPVDTEAVDPATAREIAAWVTADQLDALISTDGDSDRPLLADETGRIVPGDLIGQIAASMLQAETVVTPVSSNSGVRQKGFAEVILTKIGSPFVIAAMESAEGRVVGYEANGGFLLGFDAALTAGSGPERVLSALPTRDAVLPLLLVLSAARGAPLSAKVKAEPPVSTFSDRLQEIEPAISQAFIASLTGSAEKRAAFLADLGLVEAGCDLTDGLRLSSQSGEIVHLRPSGNAPEFRIYVEAADALKARALMQSGLALLQRIFHAGN